MKTIPLTRGKIAIVDDDDYERLSKHKWQAETAGNSFRASRWITVGRKRRRVLMHREILGLAPGIRCDHKDLDELNNQKSNLRIANNSQNGANRRPWGSSRFKGVSWNKGCKHWIVYIRKDYKRSYVGCFHSEEEAARAYDAAAKIEHGEFAWLNFPERESASTQ